MAKGEKMKKKTDISKILKGEFRANWQLYVLILLPIAYVAIFMYGPMYGIQIAFKDYIAVEGITGSPWVGLKYFAKFINSYEFMKIFLNTLRISVYCLIAGFPLPIILALSINVIKNKFFKKTVQLITYAPYFISTVVLVGMMSQLLSTHSYGMINSILGTLGAEPIKFMTDASLFDHVYVWSGIWQGMGWSSIIYIAALSSVDISLYEAATIDGASAFQRILYIDLPSILPTIAITLILSSGSLLSVGFEKIMLMQNGSNIATSEVISTYVYKMSFGTGLPNYSYSTAIGLFNSLICFIILIIVNYTSKKVSKTSLW